MVVGNKDTVAHVQRAIGEGGAAVPSGAPVLTRPGSPAGEASAPKAPLRHAPHPYDALVNAGSDPADVYILDVRAIAADIDVSAMLEALHRVSPQGTFIALSDEAATLPLFTTRVARGDATALRALLSQEGGGGVSAPPGSPPAKSSSSGSALGKTSATPIAQPSAAPQGHEEDDSAPRSLAVGGSSR
jgi:hypothetical protein